MQKQNNETSTEFAMSEGRLVDMMTASPEFLRKAGRVLFHARAVVFVALMLLVMAYTPTWVWLVTGAVVVLLLGMAMVEGNIEMIRKVREMDRRRF